MATKRIPLIGSLINRNADTYNYKTYDQRFVNCFPEFTKNAATGQVRAFLLKRPGFFLTASGPASSLGTPGVLIWSGSTNQYPLFCFFNSGASSLTVYDLGGVTIGGAAIPAVSFVPGARLSETTVSATPYIVLMARLSSDWQHHAWFTNEFGTSWTEITDAQFVPNATLGTVTGSIAGFTLTTTVSSTGVNLPIGTRLGGNGVSFATQIKAIGTAVAGVGTYTVSITQSVSSRTITALDNWLVGNAVHVDGYMFVMDKNGVIWNSDLNSLSSWAATSSLAAQTSPDGGVGLAKTKNLIIGFGVGSIEFFQNAGNATGSPLTRIGSATVKIGAYIKQDAVQAIETITTIGDDVYFIGQNLESAVVGIYKISGTSITKISNANVDKSIQKNTKSWGFVGVTNFLSMQHLILATSSTLYDTFAYCIDTGIWWVFQTGLGVPSAIVGYSGNAYITTLSLGYYLVNSQLGWMENALPLSMTIQTQSLDQDTNRTKFYQSAELICDSQTISGNISISWSDDDYATFSTARTIDSSTGLKRIKRLGSTMGRYNNKRAWKITESVDRPFRGEALDIEYTVGEI